MRRIFRIVVFAGFVIGLSACQGRQFEPYWLVNKLRVLGIQSELPELRPGDTTTFRTIAVSDREVSYEWEWCPFDTQPGNGFECPFTQEELIDSLPDDVPAQLFQFEDFDLGTEAEATLPYPAAQPVLAALCEGIQDALSGDDVPDEVAAALPSFNCEDGLDVSVRLRVSDGDDEIIASKRVNLWLESEQEQDVNPDIRGMQIRIADPDDEPVAVAAGHDWVTSDDWVDIPTDGTLPILMNIEYDVRVTIEPDSVQTYARRAPEGSDLEFLDPELEVFEFRWFVDAGSFGDDGSKKFFFDGTNTLEDAGQTAIFLPTTDESQERDSFNGEAFIENCPEVTDNDGSTGCEMRLWTVVRDDRFGMDFVERQLFVTGVAE